MCSEISFDKCVHLCNYHPDQDTEHFHDPEHSLHSQPPIPHPRQYLINFYHFWLTLPIPERRSYKWKGMLWSLLCLAIVTWHNVLRCIHIIVILWSVSCFFLVLSSILLYKYITVCIRIHQSRDIWVGSTFEIWITLLSIFSYR